MTTMNEIVGIVFLMLASALLGATLASLLVANIVHTSRDTEVAELTQKNGDLVAQLVMYEQAKSPVIEPDPFFDHPFFDDLEDMERDEVDPKWHIAPGWDYIEPTDSPLFDQDATTSFEYDAWIFLSPEEVEVYETYMRGGETHEAAVAYILSLRDNTNIVTSDD